MTMQKAGINNLKNSEDLALLEARQFDCCKDLTDKEIVELLEELKVLLKSRIPFLRNKKKKMKN